MPFNLFNKPSSPITSNPLTSYAAGTAYTLTNSSSAVVFGTTSPSITVTQPGTYFIHYTARITYNAATFAASRIVTTKLRRTNNTAADVSNSTSLSSTVVVTTLTGSVPLAEGTVIYSTNNSDDILTLFSEISALPSAGTISISEANIIAIRLQS